MVEYHLSQRGKWYTSQRFHELGVAKSWGLKPSEWDSATEFDRAEMLAYDDTINSMKSYEEHLDEEQRLRDEARRNMK